MRLRSLLKTSLLLFLKRVKFLVIGPFWEKGNLMHSQQENPMILLSELPSPSTTGLLCHQTLWSKAMLVRVHERVKAVRYF